MAYQTTACVTIAHAFSDTPDAGDAYTLTGTLFVPASFGSNSIPFLADSAAENQAVGLAIVYLRLTPPLFKCREGADGDHYCCPPLGTTSNGET